MSKIVVDSDTAGLGDSVNDLIAAVNDGSAVIPQDGSVFTPIETADGTNFDGDDTTAVAGTGQTFNLTGTANAATGGVDNVVGTTQDDIIRAVEGNTLNSSDTIDGKEGNDTLTIFNGGNSGGVAPTISNVERINNSDADPLNLGSSTGVGAVWTQDNAGTYTGADLATIFGSETCECWHVLLTSTTPAR